MSHQEEEEMNTTHRLFPHRFWVFITETLNKNTKKNSNFLCVCVSKLRLTLCLLLQLCKYL